MRIFTTGQVAKITRTCCRTVGTWVDKGLMPGSYRLPGTHDRRMRIPESALREFLATNGMPTLEELEAADAEGSE